jgi:hypothetical protein
LASNYDVSSDDSCDDCCNYPTISLGIKHLWNDTTYRFGDTLTDQNGNGFILLDQKLMMSKFMYETTDGNVIEKIGSLAFTIDGEEVSFDNDYTLILKNQSSVSIQNYRAEGVLKKYTLQLGLDGMINQISAAQAENDNDLKFSNNMRVNNEYASYYLQLARGDSLTDTIDFFFTDDFVFEIDTLITIRNGSALSLPLTINYNNWFDGINFKEDDVTDITEKIKINTTKSFE